MKFIRCKAKWNLEVSHEPGEAVGWQTGWLVSSVVDTLRNGMDIAVLDISVSAHMPDCLEMPYRPDILNAAEPLEKQQKTPAQAEVFFW